MPLLDRYIARQYLTNVLALLAIILCFVVMIDVSLNLDRLARAAGELAERRGEPDPGALRRAWLTAWVSIDLWWPRLVQLFGYLLGMILVGAMGFTGAQLARHRELLAILSSGQSLYRVLRPILVVAAGFVALQAANRELLIPRVAPLLQRDHGDAGKPASSISSIPLASDGQSVRLRADRFDPAAGTLSGVYALLTDDQGRTRAVVRAESARWDPAAGAWILDDPDTTPRGPDAPSDIRTIETDLDPVRLRTRRDANYRQSLSFAQTGDLLAQRDALDRRTAEELARVRWGRFTIAATNILALLIATPFFLPRRPDELLGRAVRGAPLALLALVGGVLGSSAVVPGLPPQLSVVLPVAITAPIAIACLSTLRT